MKYNDKLAATIYDGTNDGEPWFNAAAAAVGEAFVVVDRDDLRPLIDSVFECDAQSPYIGDKEPVRSVKSGPAVMAVSAGAAHAYSMAKHYLALAAWLNEHQTADDDARTAIARALFNKTRELHEDFRNEVPEWDDLAGFLRERWLEDADDVLRVWNDREEKR